MLIRVTRITAVAGTRFTNPANYNWFKLALIKSMFITAEVPWGCGLTRRLGLRACAWYPLLISWQADKGILTGVLKLACIILVAINTEARTKPFVPAEIFKSHLSIFSAILSISYTSVTLCNTTATMYSEFFPHLKNLKYAFGPRFRGFSRKAILYIRGVGGFFQKKKINKQSSFSSLPKGHFIKNSEKSNVYVR